MLMQIQNSTNATPKFTAINYTDRLDHRNSGRETNTELKGTRYFNLTNKILNKHNSL